MRELIPNQPQTLMACRCPPPAVHATRFSSQAGRVAHPTNAAAAMHAMRVLAAVWFGAGISMRVSAQRSAQMTSVARARGRRH